MFKIQRSEKFQKESKSSGGMTRHSPKLIRCAATKARRCEWREASLNPSFFLFGAPNVRRRSVRCQNPNWPLPFNNVDDDVLAGPAQGEIGFPIANRKIAENNLIEKCWQDWLVEGDMHLPRFETYSKTRLQHEERSSSRPGLRCAGDGIKGWPSSTLARKSTEQFGESS
jgi:hypothetical protein